MPVSHLQIPQQISGFELAPVKGLWSVIVPEATTNYLPDPSFENSTAPTFTATNAVITRVTTWQVRGLNGIQIVPSSAASSALAYAGMNPTTVALPASTLCTLSFYLQGAGGEAFTVTIVINGTTVVNAKTFRATGDVDRVSASFYTPAAVGTTSTITITKTSATTQTWWTDAWQLEPKGYVTQYVDGDQSNGQWIGQAQASASSRAANVAYGRSYNLKDLGYRVTGYQGGGMPPIANLSTPYGLLGGEFYQRTVPQARVVTLLGVIESRNLIEQQQLRQRLINFLAPYNATQQAVPLYLQYQDVDACGQPTGKVLEMPATYMGDLTGNETNFYLDTFPLQFKEYLPPSVQEPRDNISTLTEASFGANTNLPAYVRSPDTGLWAGVTIAGASPITAKALATKNNQVWVGGSTAAAGFAGSINPDNTYTNFATASAPNASVNALLAGQTAGQLYAGGAFTTPFTYMMKWTGSAWASTSSASLNNTVYGFAYNTNGNVIAVGAFTAPASKVAQYTGSGWTSVSADTISGGGAIVYCVAVGPDGSIYVGGDFTSPGTGVLKYNATTGHWVGLGTITGVVYAMAFMPDGSLVVGGTITAAGGITVNKIARWNGVTWQDMNPSADGRINTYNVYSINIPSSGGIYIGTSNDQMYYNGSQWTTDDFQLNCFPNTPTYVTTTPNGTQVVAGPFLTGGSGVYQTASVAVNYQGTAPTYPIITITNTAGFTSGSDNLMQITNNTTKASIFFDNSYIMPGGEVLTLNTDPRNFSLVSSYRGKVLNQILAGSNLAGFALVPGVNNISLFCLNDGSTTPITMQVKYRNTHWGFESGVGT